jgi:hypothetical protein
MNSISSIDIEAQPVRLSNKRTRNRFLSERHKREPRPDSHGRGLGNLGRVPREVFL